MAGNPKNISLDPQAQAFVDATSEPRPGGRAVR
jgi:hypothetical protein